jgi:uncharacterized membrane protein YphA (DoxX/SURF4 family)
MNILLWVLQIVLALLCIAGGYFQIFKIEELQKTIAAMRELPHGLWTVLGAFGFLAGICLIVPGVIKVLPNVTPIAAAAVVVQSDLISAIYIYYRDFPPCLIAWRWRSWRRSLPIYGRFVLKPF